MALKHRKLYPFFTATNDTKTCSEYCYPACSYACFPVFNYLPPPLPPPRFYAGQPHDSYILQTAVIISVVILFFLVSIFVAKACMKQMPGPQSPERVIVTEEEGILNEVRVDNPIWYISTIGLQQSVINSISICKYKKNEGLVEGTDCSVCLSEFQENETLRLLPKCSHAFHISCIDTWLRSHTNCPLCRSIIVTDSVVGSETMIRALMGRENNGDPRSNEETQLENSGSNSESGHNSEVTDNEDETRMTHDGDERISKEEDETRTTHDGDERISKEEDETTTTHDGDERISKEEDDGEERVRKTKVSKDSSSSDTSEV